MKMTHEHYAALKTAVTPVMAANPIGNTPQWSPKRWRWACLYCANKIHASGGGIHTPSSFVCRVLYQYLNDSHIDTALRRIAKEAQA